MSRVALFGIAMVLAAVSFFMIGATRDDTRELAGFLICGAGFAFVALLTMMMRRGEYHHQHRDDDDQ